MPDFLNLKLDEYFNNKIIADESSVKWIKENMQNFGMYAICGYFLASSLPNSNELIHINNVPYIFPDKSESNFDNISCEEQIISIPNVSCNAIHFLGTSEFGDNYEEYSVSFSNVNITKDTMFIPDSCSKNTWKYEKQDYNCGMKGTFSNLNTHWFYYYTTILENKKDNFINSIILPYNPNIHIMAITIEY